MAQAKTVVVDASVAVKWFSNEQHTDRALHLKTMYETGRIDLLAPELFPYEVSNALRYNPGFGVVDVKKAFKAIEDLQLTYYPLLGEVANLSVELAYTYGLSLYDAAYVAVASISASLYYTADTDVVRKVAKPFVRGIAEIVVE